jgi:hypothetical protein
MSKISQFFHEGMEKLQTSAGHSQEQWSEVSQSLLDMASETLVNYSRPTINELTFDCKECPDGIAKVQWQDGQEIPVARCSHCPATYTVTLEEGAR